MEPVLYLRRDYDLSETIVRKTVKNGDGDKYFVVVFKNTYGKFCWFYQDCCQPYAFHDIATGFETEKDAREDLANEIGVDEI